MPRHARPARSTVRTMCLGAGVATAGTAFGGIEAPPAAAADTGAAAVALAAHEAGDPYVYGAAGPNSFDCSGLVMYVYAQLGIRLPHNAELQYGAVAHVAPSAAVPGDIIFFHDSAGHIYHDGIYAGGGQFWAAPHTGDVVKRAPIYSSSYYVGRPGGGSGTVAPAPTSTARPVASPVSAAIGGMLQQGATGPAVAALQHALGVPADGEFGPQTAAAVRAFQSAHRLVADGVVGPATRAALAGAAPTPVSAAPVAVSATLAFSSVLRLGASGPAVVTLQQELGIAADGDFGPQTLAAVLAFQRGHGLLADGEVGPLTRAALSRRAA